MEFFYLTELTIPAIQMALLLLLNTLALLFGKIKLALLTTYMFTLFWGYILNRNQIFDPSIEQVNYFVWAYFGFGIIVIIFALLGFLVHQKT